MKTHNNAHSRTANTHTHTSTHNTHRYTRIAISKNTAMDVVTRTSHTFTHALPTHAHTQHRYTRIAMGKNTAMDVVTGESSGTSGQLLLLYPLLFGAF